MKLLSEEVKPYGHLDYLPNPTQDFIAVLPELYNIDIQVYWTLAANIIDFINFKTIRITSKEISEKLAGKSRPSIRNSLSRLKATTLPFSGKPLVIQERDMYILPDFRHAAMIRNAKEREKRHEDLAKRADELLEKKAKKLGEAWTDEHGYPRPFHINRLKKEVIEELNLDFDPWDLGDDSPS